MTETNDNDMGYPMTAIKSSNVSDDSVYKQWLYDALEFAMFFHGRDQDRNGYLVLNHVITVAGFCSNSPVTAIVGLLHDIVEDTDCTVEMIRKKFNSEIADAVDAMTRRPGEKYFQEYLPRLMENRIAVKVKHADSTHNLERCERELYELHNHPVEQEWDDGTLTPHGQKIENTRSLIKKYKKVVECLKQ